MVFLRLLLAHLTFATVALAQEANSFQDVNHCYNLFSGLLKSTARYKFFTLSNEYLLTSAAIDHIEKFRLLDDRTVNAFYTKANALGESFRSLLDHHFKGTKVLKACIKQALEAQGYSDVMEHISATNKMEILENERGILYGLASGNATFVRDMEAIIHEGFSAEPIDAVFDDANTELATIYEDAHDEINYVQQRHVQLEFSEPNTRYQITRRAIHALNQTWAYNFALSHMHWSLRASPYVRTQGISEPSVFVSERVVRAVYIAGLVWCRAMELATAVVHMNINPRYESAVICDAGVCNIRMGTAT